MAGGISTEDDSTDAQSTDRYSTDGNSTNANSTSRYSTDETSIEATSDDEHYNEDSTDEESPDEGAFDQDATEVDSDFEQFANSQLISHQPANHQPANHQPANHHPVNHQTVEGQFTGVPYSHLGVPPYPGLCTRFYIEWRDCKHKHHDLPNRLNCIYYPHCKCRSIPNERPYVHPGDGYSSWTEVVDGVLWGACNECRETMRMRRVWMGLCKTWEKWYGGGKGGEKDDKGDGGGKNGGAGKNAGNPKKAGPKAGCGC